MKFRLLLLALIVGMIGFVPGISPTVPTPAQASVGAYTWVKHTNNSGFNQRIMVKCHTSGDWRTMYIGTASGQVCGQNGWVDSIWVPDGGYLTVVNLNTGNYTQFGNCYKGSIGGGQYYAWVSDFPRNNHC